MAPTETLVLREDAGAVATLTLNRPDKLNARNHDVFTELRGHVDALAADDTVRCVVLTGAGSSFSAGHDLSSVRAYDGPPVEHLEAETIDAVEELPKPTIAKIRGHCYAGALELALACDLLVAARTARIADTHGRWGVVPGWGMSVRLPERVGTARAKELMFTSRRLDGEEALALGLVEGCAADEELDDAVEELAGRIVANSRGTNRIVKLLLASGHERSRQEALLHERRVPFGIPEDFAERIAGTPGG